MGVMPEDVPFELPSFDNAFKLSTLVGDRFVGDQMGTQASNSFSFEEVAAVLQPFYSKGVPEDHPTYPINRTQGLIFPYNPSITENVNIAYDRVDLTHSNEGFHAYKNTDNVKINISDAVWTCDTFDNAVYALAALHFFRMHSFMDFGRGRSGRPPSPMWFSAYGNFIYRRIPVLLQSADWSFPNDVDYVGVPEFGTSDYVNKRLATSRNTGGRYSWMPVKFTVTGINLVVQHSPAYWTGWNLDDYWSGRSMARGTAHTG